jgi:predicted outer membrane protein
MPCLNITILGLAAILTVCCKTDPGDRPTPSLDRQFAVQAASANLAAMSFGAYVAAQGEDPSVRAFARTTAEEHHAAHEELKKIGDTINFSLPADLDSLGSAHLRQLSARSGRDLDTAYLAGQIAQFRNSMIICQSVIKAGKSTSVTRYAAEYHASLLAQVSTGDSLMGIMRFK